MVIQQAIRRLSIAKKFGYSYGLAIGIAIVGTAIGMVVGEYYERQAINALRLADEQEYLLVGLERSVAEIRAHPHRLAPTLGRPIWANYEKARLDEESDRIWSRLEALNSFVETYPDHLVVSQQKFKQLLQGYDATTRAYLQRLKYFWHQIEPPKVKRKQVPAMRLQIVVFVSSLKVVRLEVRFESLTEQLGRLIKASEVKKAEASKALDRAQILRQTIISISMVASVILATLLAIYTSRAIARPLLVANQIAQQVTEEPNFDLRVPVTTEDEVGSLAASLNQLIQWVGNYTRDLEDARQTLEERTQALTQTLHDLKQTQAQLIQSEKMSSLGQLVGGVAHEINNPVSFIRGNLNYAKDYTDELLSLVQLYQKEYPEPTTAIEARIKAVDLGFLVEDIPKVLSSMRSGTERIQEIVLSLRNFSRLDEAEMKTVDIHEGIESTLLILNHRLRQRIRIVKHYHNLPLVDCYPAQLNQVFMHLFTNAIDALENVNKIKAQIEIWTIQLDDNRVQVKICDNGVGIPLDIQDRLFEPFFTTKEIGKGTGLGLSICYQIIKKHRGKIDVFSTPGKGAEFAIALPIVPQKS